MIDLRQKFETFIDQKTAEFMPRITYAQIVEALSCNINDEATERLLAGAVRDGNHITIGTIIQSICYQYYRSVMAEKYKFDTWVMEREADIAADKAEYAHELYETNRWGD